MEKIAEKESFCQVKDQTKPTCFKEKSKASENFVSNEIS